MTCCTSRSTTSARCCTNAALAERGEGRPVSEQEAVVALRIIASRLGVQTLRRRRYDDGPAELERESGPSGLPTATRIDASLKTNTEAGWDRGLRLAGLTVRRAKGGITGMSREDAIDRFIAEHDDRPQGVASRGSAAPGRPAALSPQAHP
jgi:hypothetical protein